MKSKTAATVLFKKKSKYQTVELSREAGGLLLRLNGNAQVHSAEERLYHEAFAALPMMLAKNVSSVLILGGGDGLALREVLRFKGVKNVTLVELDPVVIELCSNNPEWKTMTGGALTDPRVNVVVGDGIKFMVETKQKFDVILHDLEDEFTIQPQALTVDLYHEFYFAIKKKLKPGGVWVTLISDTEDDLMLKAMFEEYRENLPPEVHRDFMRKRGVIARTGVLLKTLFPTVLKWPIRFKNLGTLTNFYMSDAPLKELRRQPKGPLVHIKPNQTDKLK